jgi:hypothetical protein
MSTVYLDKDYVDACLAEKWPSPSTIQRHPEAVRNAESFWAAYKAGRIVSVPKKNVPNIK